MTYRLLGAYDAGGDRLELELAVSAPDGSWEPRRAYGWVSALERHYGAESLAGEDILEPDPDLGHAHRQLAGERLEGAEPRPMTGDEALAYFDRLVLEQHPDLAPPRRRRSILPTL